jgi:hypothetical protein
MNVANTKDVFEQVLLPRVALSSAVEERLSYDTCRSAPVRGAPSDKRCLLEYNLLQKSSTDRSLLRSYHSSLAAHISLS